jgi:hypothetical protein
MKVVTDKIAISELKTMAVNLFGDMVKAVVDVDKETVAVDSELHSDLEALLLDNGSKQKDLWGINIYPDNSGDDMIEFDSMINIRPSQNNKTRSVNNEAIRKKIIAIVTKKVRS